MITLNNIRLPIKYTQDELTNIVAKTLKITEKDLNSINLRRLSIDARKNNDVHYIATVNASVKSDEKRIASKCKNAEISTEKPYMFTGKKEIKHSPIVIGSGPAGLFCALMLARSGAKPLIIERGETIDNRTKTVDRFWNGSELNLNSNVQFGEGGAGTFSDGKLNTGINDPRSYFILKEFVAHGAPHEILISAKPHIGTDKLKSTIKNIRKEIETLGGTFMFNTLVTNLITKDDKISGVVIKKQNTTNEIYSDNVVLAIGHSARDTFLMLRNLGVEMQQKAFSIGARIEHLREDVDECQYGKARHFLGAADYKLSTHLKDNRGVYTFCMCPGGYVVNASSEEGLLCTNGMSYHARSNINSNSALLVGITPADYNCGDVLDGMYLQRKIEKKAFDAIGNSLAPVQHAGDFLQKSVFDAKVIPSIKPGYEVYDISRIYPHFISDALRAGLYNLGKKFIPFKSTGAVLTAAETRSSSPIRIVRNETFQSVSLSGLYPCGEGAGYAGGIMSAAVDGIKCAEAILS